MFPSSSGAGFILVVRSNDIPKVFLMFHEVSQHLVNLETFISKGHGHIDISCHGRKTVFHRNSECLQVSGLTRWAEVCCILTIQGCEWETHMCRQAESVMDCGCYTPPSSSSMRSFHESR